MINVGVKNGYPSQYIISGYFYNKDNGKCEYFGYGGCGGNSNRFNSEEECRARCEKADIKNIQLT